MNVDHSDFEKAHAYAQTISAEAKEFNVALNGFLAGVQFAKKTAPRPALPSAPVPEVEVPRTRAYARSSWQAPKNCGLESLVKGAFRRFNLTVEEFKITQGWLTEHCIFEVSSESDRDVLAFGEWFEELKRITTKGQVEEL